MKKLLVLVLLLVGFTNLAIADVYVNGYYKKDGTYVQPHYRSNPNNNFNDNWSTKGNINPYTQQYGTKTQPQNYNNYNYNNYNNYRY